MLGGADPVELTLKLSAEEREIAHLHPVGAAGELRRPLRLDHRDDRGRGRARTALDWLRESYYLKAPAKLRDAAFADSN